MTETMKGIVQVRTFSFEWKIKGFFANCKKVGDFYMSPAIPVRYLNKVIKWSLKVYPKGDNEKSKSHVSLFLIYESGNLSEIKVDYELSIVDKLNTTRVEGKEKVFKDPGRGWGYSEFVEQDFIKNTNNHVLIDDTLKILCQITFPQIVQDTESFDGYSKWLDKIGHGLADYGKLFESENFSDVTFNVQDEKIHLHKAILSCRSPVFKAMFEHEMKEKKHSSVDITDIDYNVMKELFRFIYSEKVENIEKIAKELFVAADKYSVIKLKALCEKTLYDNFSVDNAIECLKLSDMCDTIHLKTLVIKFITANYKEVIKKPGFADLNSQLMFQIMQAIAEKD